MFAICESSKDSYSEYVKTLHKLGEKKQVTQKENGQNTWGSSSSKRIQMEAQHENRLRFISHYDSASQYHNELQNMPTKMALTSIFIIRCWYGYRTLRV